MVLMLRGRPSELAKQDHRRRFRPHPTQSTGCWCEAGDILEIVCRFRNAVPSAAPELWIISVAESPASEHKSRQIVQLVFGSQRVTVASRGVIYFAPLNFPTDTDVTVEIISGARPMPRFRLGESTLQEWEQALANYPDAPYGELEGRRMIVAMPLPVLKKNVDDPAKVTTLWDRIVTLAEECYGLLPGNPRPHQSTPFQYIFETKPDSSPGYMSASNYWLGTNFGGAYSVCNSEYLSSDGWGPWHELGHHYQLDDMTWDGMGEVTVNIVSLYVQRALQGRASRLDSKWPEVFDYFEQPDKDYSQLDNVFTKLAMFWQLDLAFGSDFYARLGRRYRTLPHNERPLNGNEKIQLFILETSRVSGYDLTGFFSMWGLMLEETTRIKLNRLKLNPLDKPIWFNTDKDNRYTYDRSRQNISGSVILPDRIHDGGILKVAVNVDNRNEDECSYHWDVPYGFRVLSGGHKSSITLIAPEGVIHSSNVQIGVTVTDPSGFSIPLASKIRLKVTGENEVYPEEYADKYIMRKYHVNELHTWSGSLQGNVGDIYVYDNPYSNEREYFRLLKVPYWYFPTNQINNSYWEFLDHYNHQYYLDDLKFDNVIATESDHVTGSAGFPMSRSQFLEQAGAITTDGSEITVFPEPANCLQPGHYEITLHGGANRACRKYVIYDVVESWGLHGNNNIDASRDFIGTSNASDLVIKTNAAERMRIKSGGNVGIGVASPTRKLDIDGELRVRSVPAASVTSDTRILTTDNTGNISKAGLTELTGDAFYAGFKHFQRDKDQSIDIPGVHKSCLIRLVGRNVYGRDFTVSLFYDKSQNEASILSYKTEKDLFPVTQGPASNSISISYLHHTNEMYFTGIDGGIRIKAEFPTGSAWFQCAIQILAN